MSVRPQRWRGEFVQGLRFWGARPKTWSVFFPFGLIVALFASEKAKAER